MTGQDVAAVIAAATALIGAVSIALWRRRATQVAGWQALVTELQERIEALHARQEATERTVSQLRREVDGHRRDIRERDLLILAHLKWDTQALDKLAEAGHQPIGEPPPLWPQDSA